MNAPARRGPLDTVAGYAWRILVIAAAVALIGYILIRLRLVVLPVIIAGFVCAILIPIARALERRGLPRMVATWAVLVGSIALFAGTIALLAPSIAGELDNLGQSVREGVDRVLKWATEGPLELSEQDIDRYIDDATKSLSENRESLTAGVLKGASLAAELVAGILLAFVLTFFFIKDGDDIGSWIVDLLPRRARKHGHELGKRLAATITGYIRGTAIIALVDAVLIGIVLVVVGVPLVPALMVLTFLGAFFPLIGAVLAGAVAALVALVTTGVTQAGIVAVAILVIQQVEGDVLQPIVMGRTVKLHPVAVLVALTAGAAVGGVIGAFLAVPLAAVIASWSGYLRGLNEGAA